MNIFKRIWYFLYYDVFKIKRKLKGHWTIETLQELKHQHGMDLEEEIIQILTQELKEELKEELKDVHVPLHF